MATVGYATLQIIPSVRGIGDELRRQLVGPAGDAGERSGEAAGGGFREAFHGAMAALGVEALAEKAGELFSEAFDQAVEKSNVTGMLKAQLGAGSRDAAKYGNVIGRLYAKGVTDSYEEGAEAIRSVVNAGLVNPRATTAQLDVIATKMSDVAKTFGTDMGLQTQAVSALMKNGLAPNASAALDVITTGLQKLGPNAEDLLETFQEYPVQLRKLGLDSKTSLGLFSQGLKAGARDTDIVADALKEFSIRAVDGSQSTIAGFKGLGLSAKGMAEQISKGGKSASKGLDTVLDRLRKVPDPVKRSQLAVDLFGTQAEDLGSALYALNPSTAVKAIGAVGGAAGRLGKDLRSGPVYQLETFKRTVQQDLVTFLGSAVIPVLTKVGGGLRTILAPAMTAVVIPALVLFGHVLQTAWTVASGVFGFLRKAGSWLIPVGIAIGGLTLAMTASKIATAATELVFNAYRVAILAWTAVTEGATIAQAAFDAVMDANPVILVITAIVALAAALVVAYKRVGWFRAAVQAVWGWLKSAGTAVWDGIVTGAKAVGAAAVWLYRNALKPAFDGIVTAVQAVAAAATWLWSNVLSPVFGFISAAARVLVTALVVIAILPIIAAFKLLAAVAGWLWTAVLSPVVGWIVAGFRLLWAGVQLIVGQFMAGLRTLGAVGLWLWAAVLNPVIGWITAGFRLLWSGVQIVVAGFIGGLHTLGAAGLWLWTNVFSPVVGWIVTGAQALWTGVKIVFAYFTAGLHALGDAGGWLWHHAIEPAFNGVSSVVSGVWSKLQPVFVLMKAAVHAVGDAFGMARDAIRTAWNQLEGIAKKPVAFIVNTVYDKGILPVWNKVAGAFGAPKLGTMKFAGGGILPGYTPGRDVHLAALSGGEAVMRPEWTRAMGPGYVNAMNALARRGGVGAVQRAAGGGLPAFKDGGIFSWIGTAASAVKGAGSAAWSGIKAGAKWLKDSITGSVRAGAKAVINPLINAIPGGESGFGALAKRIPQHMLDAVLGYSKTADSKVDASLPNIGGAGVARWQPYVVKALAANHLSTSGAMVARVLRQIATESGGNPRAVQGNIGDINNRTGDLAKGLMQTISATFNHYKFPGHGNIFNGYDNLLAALNYAKHRYGTSLSFLGQGHGYDSGGWLQPGVTRAVNATGRPEAILTGPQWHAVAAQAAAGQAAAAAYQAVAARPRAAVAAGGGLQAGDRLALRVSDREFDGYVEDIADGRVATAMTTVRRTLKR